jgi:hypothetical protein
MPGLIRFVGVEKTTKARVWSSSSDSGSIVRMDDEEVALGKGVKRYSGWAAVQKK